MIACCLAALWLPAAASAATLQVKSFADSGPGSLRATINGASAGDTIQIPAGTITLTSGQLFPLVPLTLVGAGAGATFISGGGTQQMLYDSHSLTVSGVTFENGHFSLGAPGNGGGGAIEQTGGDLTISDCAFANNTAAITNGTGDFDGGGAIYLTGGGKLSVSNTTFSGNKATVDQGKDNGGGAIFASGGGAVTVTGSTFSGDSYAETTAGFPAGGGAIYSSANPVTVSASRFTGESATLKPAALNTVSDDGGGAIWSGGGTSLTGSSITGNSATVDRGAMRNGGGGIYNEAGPLSLTASTVAGNTVTISIVGPPTNGGGGVFNDNSDGTGTDGVTIADSTISANTVAATAIGGGAEAGAGGLYEFGGGGTITNTTIAANSVSLPGGHVGGGGIYEAGAGTAVQLTLKNTIVSGNTLSPVTPTKRNCDFDATGSKIISAGHNVSDDATCNLTATGDQPNTDPHIGPLAANGGPTQTRALLAGSPAIDHGDNSGCPSTDQRGVKRPVGAGCDVGAYEFAPPISSATVAACAARLRATVTPVSGSAPVALLVRVDGGAARTFATVGNPGTVTLTLPAGHHTVEYWGKSIGGDEERVHHTLSTTIAPAPRLTITSDQHTSLYAQGARASVTITASDPSGLLVNPSRRHVRISTAHGGTFTIKRTATNRCHRSTTARFTYRVLTLFDRTFTLPSNRRCLTGSKLVVGIHAPRGVRLRQVTVSAGGHMIVLRGRLPRTVSLPRPASGTFTLSVGGVTRGGKVVSGSRRYRLC